MNQNHDLGGGFKDFLEFSSQKIQKMIQFDEQYFSDGLKPHLKQNSSHIFVGLPVESKSPEALLYGRKQMVKSQGEHDTVDG